jgi:small conductance mechanosensitive channel
MLRKSVIFSLVILFFTAFSLLSPLAAGQPAADDREGGSGARDEAELLLDRVDSLTRQVERAQTATDEILDQDKVLFVELVSQVQDRVRVSLDRLIEILQQMEGESQNSAELRRRIEAAVAEQSRLIRESIANFRIIVRDLRESHTSKTGAGELDPMRLLLTRSSAVLDGQIAALVGNIKRKESLGMDAEEDDAFLDGLLKLRAVVLSGQIRVALDNIKMLKEWARGAPAEDQKEIDKQLRLYELDKDAAAAALATTVATMKNKGMDTTEFGQVLVVATGNLLNETVDTKVALGILRKVVRAAGNWLDENLTVILFRLGTFILIIFGFKLLAGIIGGLVDRAVARSSWQSSQLLRDFVHGVVSKVVIVIGVIIALSQLGIEIGPLLAGMGIMGFIVGFALQDSLSNFASGMMILLHRPFDIGDVVEAGGVTGTVQAMSLITTTFLTFDNQTLVVPNNKIWGSTIRNVTAQDRRRVDLTFAVGHDVEVARAESIFQEAVAADPRVLEEPAPLIRMHGINDYAVEFIVRPWVDTADYWPVYWDLTRAIKERMDQEGISVPHPKRDVFLHQQA